MLVACATAVASAQESGAGQTAVRAPALRRIQLETHTPIRTVSRQELAAAGHVTLGEFLQRLPFMGGSAPNLNSNAGGDGSVLADIGGFGRSRTVVMLDGHRLPTNDLLGAPAVDLDSIPMAAIERVEILLGGASPTWGADAAAGVINIISREEAQGIELTADGGLSGEGDAQRNRVSLFAGRVFGRGYVNATAEYRQRDPLQSTSRDFSAQAQALGCTDAANCVWPFGSSIVPEGAFAVPAGNALGLAPGRYLRTGPEAFRLFQPAGPINDLYSTQSDSFLRAGREGGTAALRVGYEPSAATRLTFEALFARDETNRRLSTLPLSTGRNSATAAAHPTFGSVLTPVPVASNNFFNPFGVDIFDARRRLVESGPRSLIDETDTAFAAATLHHLVGSWELEGTAAWGRSETTETVSHVLLSQLLPFALGPSGPDTAGAIRCGIPDATTGIVAAPLAGCVPVDLFGGPGTVTQEMLDYISAPQTDESHLTQFQLRMLARRELQLRLFPSPARLALGLELRRLSAQFGGAHSSGDSVLQLFETPASAVQATGGDVDQHDLFGELVLPLLRGKSGEDRLLLSTGARLSRLEHGSGFGSAFGALTWRPGEDVLLRGRLTQIYRAPTPGELFLGHRERVVPLGNPCLDVSANGTLCTGAATPTDSSSPLASVDVSYLGGGNQNLRPERGAGVSTGIVWNPRAFPNRFVSLDVSWLQLEDAIRAPGIVEILQACGLGSNAAACARLFPSAAAGALAIDGSLINGDKDTTARLDLRALDRMRNRAGEWTASLEASFLLRQTLSSLDGEERDVHGEFDIVQNAFGVAYPRLRAQASLQWNRANLGARWSIQHVGSYREVADRNGWIAGGREVEALTYHDLMLEWDAAQRWSVRLNVENVFDESPARVNNGLEANTDAPTYRLEGRFVSLSVGIALGK